MKSARCRALAVTALVGVAPACTLLVDTSGLTGSVPVPTEASLPDGPQAGGEDVRTSPPRPPSCGGGPAGSTCGPRSDDDCCAAAVVPSARFNLGNDPAFPATVSSFRLDRYEVTVGRFRAFVDSGQGTSSSPPEVGSGAHPRLPDSGWRTEWSTSLAKSTTDLRAALACAADATWSDQPAAKEAFPIVCVDWFTALAFCIWDGGTLPSEAEWEAAATGETDQRTFPWGETAPSATLASFLGGGALAAAGHYSPGGDGRFGHSDLAGGATEWLADGHSTTFPSPCEDCIASAETATRTIHGGGWKIDPRYLNAGTRDRDAPGARLVWYGMRCARHD